MKREVRKYVLIFFWYMKKNCHIVLTRCVKIQLRIVDFTTHYIRFVFSPYLARLNSNPPNPASTERKSTLWNLKRTLKMKTSNWVFLLGTLFSLHEYPFQAYMLVSHMKKKKKKTPRCALSFKNLTQKESFNIS